MKHSDIEKHEGIMNYIDKELQTCEKFKLTAGRVIVCQRGEKKGKELFTVHKEDGFSPTQADAMAHYIVNALNRKKDFDRYYKKYMKW